MVFYNEPSTSQATISKISSFTDSYHGFNFVGLDASNNASTVYMEYNGTDDEQWEFNRSLNSIGEGRFLFETSYSSNSTKAITINAQSGDILLNANSSISLLSNSDNLELDAVEGSVYINATSDPSGTTISMNSDRQINLESDSQILVHATGNTSTIDISASNIINLNATSGNINLRTFDQSVIVDSSVNIIHMTGDRYDVCSNNIIQLTGTSDISLNSTSGSVNVKISGDEIKLLADNSMNLISITDLSLRTINTNLNLDASGNVNINANNSSAINLTSSNEINLNSASTMNLTNTLGDINIKDLSGNMNVDISGHITLNAHHYNSEIKLYSGRTLNLTSESDISLNAVQNNRFLNTSSAGVTMDACGNIKLNADANSTHILLSSSNDIDLYAATDISLNAVEGNIC